MALPAPSPRHTVLVTGASSGIGEQLARSLAARGHGLTLVARRADRLEVLADELRVDRGVEVDLVPADLLDPDDRARLAEHLEALRAAGDQRQAVAPGGQAPRELLPDAGRGARDDDGVAGRRCGKGHVGRTLRGPGDLRLPAEEGGRELGLRLAGPAPRPGQAKGPHSSSARRSMSSPSRQEPSGARS